MVGTTNVHILTYLIYDDHLKTTHFHLAVRHYSNQLLYALDAVDVAELPVECTHKILQASNTSLVWMSTCTGLCGLSTGRNSLTCFSSPPRCLEGLFPLFVCP